MKRMPWLLVFALLNPSCPAATRQHQAPLTLAQAIDAWVSNTETHVVPLAEAMPEDKYSFAPAGDGFKGVRTFAEQVKHLAANNYYEASLILGEKPPEGAKAETGPDSVKSKAEIMRYLKGSFDYLHQAVATIDERNMTMPIPGTSGSWQQNRVARAIDAIAHSFNHYGQLVEYLRMNGIVPPDSR
ncbi:MAG TPA: DinB family protein [Candidatus Angelobacter sp.]